MKRFGIMMVVMVVAGAFSFQIGSANADDQSVKDIENVRYRAGDFIVHEPTINEVAEVITLDGGALELEDLRHSGEFLSKYDTYEYRCNDDETLRLFFPDKYMHCKN